MAEYVRARITAAKVGVGLAIAGVLAGVAERVRPQDGADPMALAAHRDAVATAAQKTISGQLTNKLGSKQIKNHSLLYKDFKQHQVLPYKQLKRINSLSNKTRSLATQTKTLKSQLGGVTAALGTIYNKAQANAKFLPKTGTAANAIKLGGLTKAQLVNGNGSVYSGVQHINEGENPKTLLTVPGVVTVQGNAYGSAEDEIFLTNLTGSPMTVSWNDGTTHQDTIGSDTFDQVSFTPAGSFTSKIITVQLLTSTGRAITLTVSFVPDSAGTNNGRFVAQALASP